MAKWGFRRCEDIVWVKTNQTTNRGPGVRRFHLAHRAVTDKCISCKIDGPTDHLTTDTNEAALSHGYPWYSPTFH